MHNFRVNLVVTNYVLVASTWNSGIRNEEVGVVVRSAGSLFFLWWSSFTWQTVSSARSLFALWWSSFTWRTVGRAGRLFSLWWSSLTWWTFITCNYMYFNSNSHNRWSIMLKSQIPNLAYSKHTIYIPSWLVLVYFQLYCILLPHDACAHHALCYCKMSVCHTPVLVPNGVNILSNFSPLGSHIILVFLYQPYGNIQMGTPLTGA